MARNIMGDGEDRPLIAPTPEQLAEKVVPLVTTWGADAGNRPAMAYPTLLELALYAAQHKIPLDTCRVQYAGCGSHGLELDWRDG